MRKILIALLAFISYAGFAQQIPLTGSVGVPGSAAVLGYQSIAMTDSTYTLAPREWANQFLNITSIVPLTATRNVIVPLNPGQQFTVENNTTGGQSIQIIGASGLGVTVGNGNTLIVASDGTNYIAGSSAGAAPVGATYQAQLKGSTGFSAGVQYDSTGINATNAGSNQLFARNYSLPTNVDEMYPWNNTQSNDYRNNTNPFMGNLYTVNGTSGISDWINVAHTLGNNPNMNAITYTCSDQTPFQIGGCLSVKINQHSGDDAVVFESDTHAIGINRGDNEGMELWRIFMDFNEDFWGGTINAPTTDALGNEILQIATPYDTVSNQSAGEQRVIIDRSSVVTPGNAIVGLGYSLPRFVTIFTGASHGLGSSIQTTLTAAADNNLYNGSCPSTSLGPAPRDPYASPGAVDGSATLTQHYCLTVGSTAGMSVGQVAGIFGGGINYEYTKIQSIPDSTHVVVNLKRSHDAGEYFSVGGGVGYAIMATNDTKYRLAYPIVYTPNSTQIVIFVNSDVSNGQSEYKSFAYGSNVPPTAMVVTPTVVGGVITAISTNANNYTTSGSTNGKLLPPPAITVTGCSGTQPTFSQSRNSTGGYTLNLLTGGTSCVSPSITPQATYTNTYSLFKSSRTAFVNNPTIWATENALPASTARTASVSGYMGTDPWAAPPSTGDTVELTPHWNMYMGSQINMTGSLITGNSQKFGTANIEVYTNTQSAQPLRILRNTTPSAVYIGQERNGYLPGPQSAAACPTPLVWGSGTPCYEPEDNQFTAPWGLQIDGPTNYGFVMGAPPLQGGTSFYVSCPGELSGSAWSYTLCNDSTQSQQDFSILASFSYVTAQPTGFSVNPHTNHWTLSAGSINLPSVTMVGSAVLTYSNATGDNFDAFVAEVGHSLTMDGYILISGPGQVIQNCNGNSGVCIDSAPFGSGGTQQYIFSNDGTIALFQGGALHINSFIGDLDSTSTINTVSASFYDVSSSIQTQLNGKQGTLANIPLRYMQTVTLTAAGPETPTVTGVTSANRCTASYLTTTLTAVPLVTAAGSGTVTISHATATAGDTVALFCNIL